MKTHIERMLRAMAWADRQVCAAVRDCNAAQGEALPLLAHLLAAEHVWLSRLQKQEPRHAVWPEVTLAQCEQLAGENASGYARYLDGLSEADLAAPLTYRNMRGEEFTTPVIDILTHVVIHGAYHRGQIAKVLGRAGAPTVSTDYILFVRSLEPPAA